VVTEGKISKKPCSTRLPCQVNLQSPDTESGCFRIKIKIDIIAYITKAHYSMKEQFRSRQQLADELGISTRTLSRKLNALRIDVPPGLIAPKLYAQILEKIRD
jgi:hypothetical protein